MRCRRRRIPVVVVAALATLVAASAARAADGPGLAVDARADRHAISPDIYGMNFADPTLARELDLPVDRWGGNTTDTYNWQLHSANTGNDWYFENVADCWDDAHGWCAGGTDVNGYAAFVDKDHAVGAQPLITLPMMGHVASNDARGGHPLVCGFPKTAFATQNSFDPYDANCGNGRNGSTPVPADPNRDGTPIDPTFDAAWVNDLRARGVSLFELGNEPGLWGDTHRDMHPGPETYDELWQKTHDYAAAVKDADPDAKVLGFSEWGWPNYFCSEADNIDAGCFPDSPDRVNHGGETLVEWLLRRLRDSDQSTGRRLVDYLDLHYYRQGGNTTDVTRSLWDPTYTDPSWINAQIRLLSRMHEWVAADYPGTKISLSEYNLSLSGGGVLNTLIQADTLGIFAREGLDLATRWPTSDDDGSDIADAFRIFRNYDGAHHRFGDTWVRSTSGDQGRLAVYAAQRTSDDALTVLVINKTAGALTSSLDLAGATAGGPAQVWQWTGGSIGRAADQAIGADGFTATYPARSLTLFVVPTDQPLPSPGLTPPVTQPPTSDGPGPGGQVPGDQQGPPDVTTTPPPPAISTSLAVHRVRGGANGAITVSAEASGAGTLSAVATAKRPAAAAKRRPKALAYGSASAATPAAGPLTITVHPSRAAKHALRAGKSLTVTLSIAFAPRAGAPPAPQTRTVRVRAKHK